MGGSKGGGEQTIGFRYYMTLLMGIGRGPLDEIVQINVGDVRAWPVPDGDSEVVHGLAVIAQGPNGTGNAQYENGTVKTVAAWQINTVSDTRLTSIEAPDLFGGDKREGGIQGALRVLMGAASQVVPNSVKITIGGRVSNMRGVTTLFFDGLLCSLNPYPKKWKFRVRRTTSGWDGEVWQPSLATIWLRDGSIKAMNPAHIIYECLTNRDWGRGFPRSWIDDTKMSEIAQTLYNEKFGLCLRWSRSGELGEFIQMVIDHVGGSLYVDRANGLISTDLFRLDYDPADIPLFTYSTGLLSVEDADTASQEDVINEVIVGWFDPIEGQDRQTRIHNLASLQAMGGGKNSTKKDYAGIPVSELAGRVAQRDLKAGAASLKRFKIVLDRRAWRIQPGKTFRVSAPDKDIFNVVLRAGKVDSKNSLDGRITVDAVLDVFGLSASSFVAAAKVEWTPPSHTPRVATRRLVREATYHDLVRNLGPADLQTVADDAAAIAVLASKPIDMSLAYNLATRAEGEDFVQRGSGTFLPSAVLAANIDPYATSVTFAEGRDLGLVTTGIPVQIGQEICLLTDIDPAGTMTIERGCVDTIPSEKAEGTLVFFITDRPGKDAREYVSGENVEVKILPYTSSGQLSQAIAPADTISVVGRQGRPWPPANLRVNGDLVLSASGSLGDDLVFTWAHRDRKTIQDQMLSHTAASVGLEAGTTYTFRVYDSEAATVPVRTVDGISGTTWTYTAAMAIADGVDNSVWFEGESSSSTITSFQKYRFDLSMDRIVVQASNPGGYAFTTDVFMIVPFYTETLDSENAFSDNDRYTVATTGTYRFVMVVDFAGASSELAVGSAWDLKIDTFVDPAAGLVSGQSASGAFDGTTPVTLNVTIPLTAGDVVSAYLLHDNGSNITLTSATLEITRLA